LFEARFAGYNIFWATFYKSIIALCAALSAGYESKTLPYEAGFFKEIIPGDASITELMSLTFITLIE
jgi:hypothetical protein